MEEKIEQIMENFDFEKVHKVMVALEWEWHFGRGASGIPSVYTLKEEASRLLSDAWMTKTTVSTGGFSAVYDDCYITLSFIVEEWGE